MLCFQKTLHIFKGGYLDFEMKLFFHHKLEKTSDIVAWTTLFPFPSRVCV